MSKQTAVEWLIQKLTNRQNGVFDGLLHLSVDEIYNQAKQMEKEQHENTWYAGDEDGAIHEFEYYWEETYGGNKWL